MDKPNIAQRRPIVQPVEPGTYWWCACGRSANQPFCDGSHSGSDFSPQAFTVEKDGKAFLCQCKRTGNSPFCDGAHTKLPE